MEAYTKRALNPKVEYEFFFNNQISYVRGQVSIHRVHGGTVRKVIRLDVRPDERGIESLHIDLKNTITESRVCRTHIEMLGKYSPVLTRKEKLLNKLMKEFLILEYFGYKENSLSDLINLEV